MKYERKDIILSSYISDTILMYIIVDVKPHNKHFNYIIRDLHSSMWYMVTEDEILLRLIRL